MFSKKLSANYIPHHMLFLFNLNSELYFFSTSHRDLYPPIQRSTTTECVHMESLTVHFIRSSDEILSYAKTPTAIHYTLRWFVEGRGGFNLLLLLTTWMPCQSQNFCGSRSLAPANKWTDAIQPSSDSSGNIFTSFAAVTLCHHQLTVRMID